MTKIVGDTVLVVLIFILSFFALNFNLEMAIIFVILLVASKWLLESLKKGRVDIPIEDTDKGRLKSLIIAAVIAAAFFGISMVVTGIFGQKQSLQSVVQLLATATPILSDSKILTFIGWAVIIPIVETLLFFQLSLETIIEGLAQFIKVRIPTKFEITNMWLWLVTFMISGAFMLYHLTAKGLSNNMGLMITFIFGLVSCWTVLYFKRGREAIFLHIIVNAVAVLQSIGTKLLALYV